MNTLADITNSSGTRLVDWITNPQYAFPHQRYPTLIFPNQECPNSTTMNDF